MITLRDIKKYYRIEKGFFKKESGFVKAVDGVSLNIQKGKTMGLVGESGCGKTTLGKIIVNLIEPDSGEIFIDNENIAKLSKDKKRILRKKIQFIFQDPYSSLNPRMTMKEIITEPIKITEDLPNSLLEKRFTKLLNLVRLPKQSQTRYPHQFSGGERQRIGIARALALEPQFIVCDEPVSSLDVSIQAQILNLLLELQEDLDLTYLFISHDLSVVEFISDEVCVMFRGKVVEIAGREELFKNPVHPYTKALLTSIPIPDPEIASKISIPEDISEEFKINSLVEVSPNHYAAS